MIAFRKILFYCLTAFYIVCCPILILYALGYIFAPHGDENLVKTGMIHLESLPAKATVTLDKKNLGDKTPVTLSDLVPGEYQVDVSLPHYRPWIQKVVVEAGRASIFDQILLVPKDLSAKVISGESCRDLLPVLNTRYLIAFRDEKLSGAEVYDWKDQIFHPLLPEGSPYGDAVVGKIHTVRGSPMILVQAIRKQEKIYLWFDLGKKKIEARNLTQLLSKEEADDFDWDPKDRDYFFSVANNSLNVINAREMTVHPAMLDGVSGAGFWEHYVYAFKSNSVVRFNPARKKYDGETLETDDFIASLFKSGKYYQVRMLADDLALFLGDEGELMANRLPYRFVEKGVLGYDAVVKSQRIVFWTKEKLGVIDFSRSKTRDKFFEIGPRIDWIFRKGKSIKQAFWVNEGSHVIFSDRDQIYLINAGINTANQADKLVPVQENSSFFYSDDSGKLFYLDADAGGVMMSQLLPEENFLNISLPVRTEEQVKSPK
jgi:hypothetical protein